MMQKMCGVHKASWILVLVGALNWGLIGLFQLNLVSSIFGGFPLIERLVYVLVGVAAVMMFMKDNCKMCKIGGLDMVKKEEGMKKEESHRHEGGHNHPDGGNMPPSGSAL